MLFDYCVNYGTYVVLEGILLFIAVLKHSSMQEYFVPACWSVLNICGISRGPEESFQLHLTAERIVGVPSRKDAFHRRSEDSAALRLHYIYQLIKYWRHIHV